MNMNILILYILEFFINLFFINYFFNFPLNAQKTQNNIFVSSQNNIFVSFVSGVLERPGK